MEKKWKKDYNLGIEVIDEQHKRIFENICELHSCFQNNEKKEIVDGVLTSILDASHRHFESEEGYFEKFGYENAEEHSKLHNLFEERIEKLREKYEEGKKFSEHLAEFLEEWLVHHIHDSDKDFVELFKKNGL